MAKINLLPWREELRTEQTRQFASVAAFSVILTLALVGLVHFNVSQQIEHQKFRNGILDTEITKLDDALREIRDLEATKDKLLSRMEIIQSLQQKRPQVVHMFDEIVRTVPEGIFLSSLEQKGSILTVNGVTESNGRVSAYMRNIDASEWMGVPKLQVIETKKGTLRYNNFTLTTSQSAPKEPGEEG